MSHGKFHLVYLESLKLNIQRKHKITLTEHNQLPQPFLGHVIKARRKKTHEVPLCGNLFSSRV